MQYMSKDVLLEMLGFIRHQSKFIIETTSDVKEVDELLVTTAGMVLYNSTCMCLQTVGETVKKMMLGFLGIGNNPMVGGTVVACAVDVAQVLNK